VKVKVKVKVKVNRITGYYTIDWTGQDRRGSGKARGGGAGGRSSRRMRGRANRLHKFQMGFSNARFHFSNGGQT